MSAEYTFAYHNTGSLREKIIYRIMTARPRKNRALGLTWLTSALCGEETF